MNKSKGNGTMKKTFATLMMIAMLAVMTPALDITAETADWSAFETTLPATAVSPLDGLDMLPEPAPKAAYAEMNLDPVQPLNAGQRYIVQGLRGSRFSDTAFNASLLAMVALNVADYLSTKEALKYPGLSEGNPMMKPFVKNPYVFAAVKVGFTALTYLSMKSIYKRSKPLGMILSVASNFAMSYVVANNFKMINIAKAR